MNDAPGSGFEGGDLVGRFRLERRLGEGGMGTVWVAVQEGLGRRVALKLLHPVYASDANIAGRFRREAELAASLGHPNIVQVTDFGVHEGRPYLVMDLLEGESLAERLARGVLTPEEASFIGVQMLSALEVAHRRDVVHRDLKPDNVFLTSLSGVRDIVKLLDFGIARLVDPLGEGKMTTTGQVLGTPAYMSPEQARGQSVDPRSDLYAVGVVLYEALCGRTPFLGENYHQLMFAIVDEAPPSLASLRPGLPAPLVAVIERALNKDPAARFATAVAMREALQDAVSTRAPRHERAPSSMAFAQTLATPQPLSGVDSLPTATKQRRVRGPVIGVVVAALLGFGGALLWRAGSEEASPSLPASILDESDAADVAVHLDAGQDAFSDVGVDSGPDVSTAAERVAVQEAPRAAEPRRPEPPRTGRAPVPTGAATQMVPCGADGRPQEMWNVRPGMSVRVTSMTSNNVVRLDDLRPRVQSEEASATFGRCYSGHALLAGQLIRLDIDESGHVGAVSFSSYCPVAPEVKSCITQFVRSLDFAGVVVTPGEISVGLSAPR